MSDHFDPYYTWLGIPPEEQPPDHYRLLGVRKFEGNVDVISNAVDQRMAHIRTLQTGSRAALSQEILGELSRASICLLNLDKKTVYDRELRQKDAPKLSKSSGTLLKARPLAPPRPATPGSGSSSSVELNILPPASTPPPASQPQLAPTQSRSIPVPVVSPTAASAAKIADSVDIPDRSSADLSRIVRSLVPFGVSCGAVVLVGGIAIWAIFGRGGASEKPGGTELVATVPKASEKGPESKVVNPEESRPSDDITPQTSPKLESPDVEKSLPKPAATPGTGKSTPTGSIPAVSSLPQPAETASALRLGAGGFVEVMNSKGLADASQTFTVEAWVRLDPQAATHFIAGDRVDGPRHPDVPDDSAAGWRFRLVPEKTPLSYTAALAGVASESTLKIRVAELPFHHIAICAEGGKLTAFVDGKYAITHDHDWSPSPLNLHLGGHKFLEPTLREGLGGDLLAARLSANCRYSKNFSPPTAFEIDSETLVSLDAALSADGNVLPDLSNHRRFGVFSGSAKLVQSGPPASPGDSLPASKPSSTGKTTSYDLVVGRPVDLIALFRAKPTTFSGSVSISEMGLSTNGNRPDVGGLQTPIPEQYFIDAEVERTEDGEGFIMGLVAQGRQFSVILDGRVLGGARSCIELADGLGLGAKNHPCERTTPVMVNRQRHRLRFMVLKDEIIALCDDKVKLRWSGDANRLSLSPRYHVTDSAALFVGAWGSSYNIFKLDLVPILAAKPKETVVAKGPDPVPSAPVSPGPVTPVPQPEHPLGPRPGFGENSGPTTEPRPGFGEPLVPKTGKRTAAPETAVQDKARIEVRTIFKQELSKAVKPAEKSALADKLYALAKDEKEQPATRYVLFEEARNLKLEAGDVAGAFQIVDSILAAFETDPWKLKSAALKRGGELSDTNEERKRLAEMAIKVAEAAFAASNFEVATEAAVVASNAAKLVGETKLRTTTRNLQLSVDAGKKQYDLAQLAWERLKAEPDNPKANLAWGRYVSFVKRDWKAGLPYLAKGDSDLLKTAAAADLALPKESEQQTTLADSWYDAAQAASGHEKESLLMRAREWYLSSLPEAGGLTKLRVQKRLDEIAAALPREAVVAKSGAPAVAVASTNLPGMIGRCQIDGRDSGLVVSYEAGGFVDRAKIFETLKIPMIGVLQVELVGVLHVPSPATITVKHAGGAFAGGSCMLVVGGKPLGQVGDGNALDDFYRLTLPAGDHPISWTMRGRNIGTPQLSFINVDSGEPLLVSHTRQMKQAVVSVPTRGELSFPK